LHHRLVLILCPLTQFNLIVVYLHRLYFFYLLVLKYLHSTFAMTFKGI